MSGVVLPDTSVWIGHYRGHAPALRALERADHLVTCGPVVAELVQGLDPERGALLWQRMAALPWVELGRAEWRTVGEVAARLRAGGAPAGLTDVQIAVAAAAAGATLLTADTDVGRIKQALPGLAVRVVAPRRAA